MTCEAIISDSNGTLFKDIDEEAILRTIAADLASVVSQNKIYNDLATNDCKAIIETLH